MVHHLLRPHAVRRQQRRRCVRRPPARERERDVRHVVTLHVPEHARQHSRPSSSIRSRGALCRPPLWPHFTSHFLSRRSREMIGRCTARSSRCCSATWSARRRSGESVDPEALQGLLARYFERMKAIVESHGGSVEKFIGDAVMAVFGVPGGARGRCAARLPGGGRDAGGIRRTRRPGTDRREHRRGRDRDRGAARDRRRGQRGRAAAAGGRAGRGADRRGDARAGPRARSTWSRSTRSS